MSVILGIAVVAIIIFYVWQHVQIVKMGYLISRLQSETQMLGNEKKLLEIEKEGLRSLARIEGIAREENQFLIPRDKAVVEFYIPVSEENSIRTEERKENSLTRFFEVLGFNFGT